MRILTVDVGNTRTKTALWTDEGRREWDHGEVDLAIASVTGEVPDWGKVVPGVRVEMLSAETPLPIATAYSTPATLGADRKAAACGAWALARGRNCVIVDAGTCVTIDLLDSRGTYQGGAILPGLKMKFAALNTFTARLPLLDISADPALPADGLTGKSTEESMTAGVITATQMEVEAFVDRYRDRYGEVEVIVTGGDAERLAPKGARIEPELVLIGLREIAESMAHK